MVDLKRREFITLLGGAAAAWPLAASAQQSATPIVGFVTGLSSNYVAGRKPAFRRGLQEVGYVEGQNVVVEYHSVEGQSDRLSGVVTNLIERKAAVIVAVGGTDPAKAAKAATITIPIVFISAADPLSAGIVTRLNRPEGNITGISILGTSLEAKRLGLLHDIVPGPSPIGVLVNPGFSDTDLELREVEEAAGLVRRQVHVVHASAESEFDGAFASLAQQGVGGLLIASDPFFASHRDQLVALAARYKLPTIYHQREFAEAGGLVSYAPDFADGYRQGGVYVGKILKGARPADLPIMQSSKFELVINLKTARILGLTIPAGVLSIADEVIE
jgi:putative tryptophan/tyrosine transport system substrate-binding protein